MNCRSARQLVSPYLDGQLTGREMLALGDHLAECEPCQQEMESLRHLKALLRGLAVPQPPLEFSRQLSAQEIYTQSMSWRVVRLAPRPQRGRRLMAALALSCLTLFALVPASQDGQATSSGARLPLLPAFAGPVPQEALLLPPSDAAVGTSPFALSGPSRQGIVTFAAETTFDRSFAYAPYGQAAAPFQTSRKTDKTVFTSYHPR